MLVLSRKIGEIITVGNSIEISVLSYDRGVVRLGINAPKSVPVHRKEVHDKIISLNKQAAKTEIQAIKDAMHKSKYNFNTINGLDSNIQSMTFTSAENKNDK
jgi:carbon storage regulator